MALQRTDCCYCIIIKFLLYYNLLQQLNRTMDLPYPSLKDDQLAVHLSPFDRRKSLVIKDSLKNIPLAPSLPRSLRTKITNLIKEDLPYELKELTEKEVVSFRSEIGRQGSYENVLHVVCRQNAAKCLEFVCKAYYQYFPQDYEGWVNTQTKEGLTAVMISALSHSNQCLMWLLKMGGVDIHLIDGNKLSAYQMALNCKNEVALKLLMEFQNKSRREKSINSGLLSQEVQLKKGRIGWCQTFYKCLLDCITCGSTKEKENEPRKQNKKTVSLLGTGIDGLFMDQVELGFTSAELGHEVEWKLMGEYQQKGNYGVLFENFSPYDMEDVNCPLNNFLIMFQSLSQHPWLIRRILQSQKAKPGNYTVNVFQKNMPKTVTTDGFLPFIAQTAHPLFIADKKEGWPMLLQKAMAKIYGSYKKLKSIETKELMENMTGWPVITIPFAAKTDIYSLLKRLFFTQKYMYVLEGKANSLLSPSDGSISCFTVLNFYEKGDKRLVLINCPFVDPAWMEKQRHEILALKILRGHFNCRNQMTIWVEEDRLSEYFSQVLVAPIKSGYQRQTVQMTVTEQLYFKIQVESADESIVVYVIDMETGALVASKGVQGWKDEKEDVELSTHEFQSEGIIQFQSKEGEYFFKFDVKKGKYMIVAWAPEMVKIQPLEQTFGLLQWTACFRKNLYANWKKDETSFIGYTANCSIVVIKTDSPIKKVNFQSNLELLQGKRIDGNEVQMIDQGDFGYIVIRGRIDGSAIFYQS